MNGTKDHNATPKAFADMGTIELQKQCYMLRGALEATALRIESLADQRNPAIVIIGQLARKALAKAGV